MSRAESLIGQDTVLGFRHFYSGILTDIDTLINVVILDQNGVPVHTILAGDIIRTGVGTYEAIAPGNLFSTPGTYYDIWNFIPVPTANQRSLRFEIFKVAVLSSMAPELPAALNCSIADLDSCMLKKYYLWPVWSTLSNGYYLADKVLQHHIDSAISKFQRLLNMPLVQTKVLTPPFDIDQVPANPVLGVDYQEEGRLIQWSNVSTQDWSAVKLPHNNIIRVTGVRGIYANRTIYRIPQDWISRNEFSVGLVRIRPTTIGALSTIVDNNGKFLDVTLLEAVGHITVPGFWAIDYEYGPKGSVIAKEICEAIMKTASITLLNQIGQSITRGLAGRSASVDGLSSSLNFVANAERTIFGGLVASYERDLQDIDIVDMKRHYKGINIFIL